MDAENDKINEIGNELNYYRHAKLLTEVCTRIMMMVFKKLYNWPDGYPHNLADHLDEIPVNHGHQKPLRKLIGPGEILKVQDMKKDKQKLRGYDITFYFKLIQFATNSGLLKPLNDNVWNKNCPEDRKGELEHLLFLIKVDRNDFSHKDDQFLNLKDEDIESFCDTLRERLPSIIDQTGKRFGEDQTVVDDTSNKFRDDIESIRVMKDISSSDETPVLKLMIQKDLTPKLEELNRCFEAEHKSYCPPHFSLDNGTSISTEELLSNDDSRVICIKAEAGYGKTSFTKFVQRKLFSEIEKAGDDHLGSREIPIRIACRNITGRSVSEFLEEEIPFSRHYASNTSSLKKFLEQFPILWIIDGYDERTVEFNGFFMSLLKTLSIKHKIIVTSRPNSLKELKEELKGKTLCEVTIECFNNQQIKGVAKDYLGEDKVVAFVSAIERLNDETLKFVKIPINLSLCLELWSSDQTIFDEEIKSIHQLYDMMMEKQRNLLFSRLKGMAIITSEVDLKVNVDEWFKYLCEVVSESAFTYDLIISEAQKVKLIRKASNYGLIGTYCLSTFFNTDNLPVETNYFIRHKTQKEVLSCVYLKECDGDALKAVAQQSGNHDLLNEEYEISNRFHHLKFLMECCNRCEFARIFVPLLEIYSGLQRPDCLLQIKDENETYFNALMEQFKASSQSLVLHVHVDREVDDLLKVHPYLTADLNSLKIKINHYITMHEKINDFISKYKNCNSFVLNLHLIKPDVFVRVIQMVTKGNKNVIKELDLMNYIDYTSMTKWTEEMKKELFKLESLNFVSFDVDCRDYSSSILHHFATEEIDHPPQTASTTTSLAAFDQSTNLHFRIYHIKDSSKVIEDLLKVNSKFPSMSVELEFDSESRDLPDNLLPRFLSSSVQVKELQIELNVSSSAKFFNVMKLVNDSHIETLVLLSINQDESSSVSEFESFFAFWDFDKLNKMKQIRLHIFAKSPLKVIYNKLPSDLLNKTELYVYLYKSSAEMEIVVDSKQFKRIQINENSKYLSASEIDELKSISKSFRIFDKF